MLAIDQNQRFLLGQAHLPLNDGLDKDEVQMRSSVKNEKQTMPTSLLPDLLRYLVEAMYDALTVSTTAFIRFLAAVIKEVALSS